MRLPRTLIVLTCGALSAGAAAEPPKPVASGGAQVVLGQWVWTRRDAAVFAKERAQRPELVPAVLAATVFDDLRFRYGLSPDVAGKEVSVVVRFDESVHRVWTRLGDDAIASRLNDTLATLLARVRDTGVELREIQLDYDVPERRLVRWAQVVGKLAGGALHGVPLWVTSIPSHVAQDEYASLFRAHVTGHVLQLFDTGTPCTAEAVVNVRARLEAQAWPFRLGIARFERGHGDRPVTDHGCWARAAATFTDIPGYTGAWVFPAGAPLLELASVLDRLGQGAR